MKTETPLDSAMSPLPEIKAEDLIAAIHETFGVLPERPLLEKPLHPLIARLQTYDGDFEEDRLSIYEIDSGVCEEIVGLLSSATSTVEIQLLVVELLASSRQRHADWVLARVELLLNNEDSRLRCASIRYLRQAVSPRNYLLPLIERLRDSSSDVRTEALASIDQICMDADYDLGEDLLHDDPDVRHILRERLLANGHEEIVVAYLGPEMRGVDD